MAFGDIDFGGQTVIAKDFKTGAATGSGSNVRQTVAAGSTLTLTRSAHAGKTILLDTLTGSVVTLPAATGTGDTYRFLVSVAPTSNNHIVKVANATDTMTGIFVAADSAGVSRVEAATGTDDTITMNGTTTGGIAGTYIECTDVASTLWKVNALAVGSGTLATSLSATV
jgi:hypothetical protein